MDPLTKAQRSRLMSSVRQRGTRLERLLRSALRKRGVRYQANVKLPGTPDIAVKAGRIAIFVDGCFWHGCPRHGTMPKTNRYFWRQKILRNRQRDGEVDKVLRKLGWKAVRVWEHDIKTSADDIADKLYRLTERRLVALKRRGR